MQRRVALLQQLQCGVQQVLADNVTCEWASDDDLGVWPGPQHHSVADIGEGDEAFQLMIAVMAPTQDGEREIDLGGGQLTGVQTCALPIY